MCQYEEVRRERQPTTHTFDERKNIHTTDEIDIIYDHPSLSVINAFVLEIELRRLEYERNSLHSSVGDLITTTTVNTIRIR